MASNLKVLTDWLITQGIDRVGHTGKTYLAHLIGVHRDLEAWGCPPDVCRAGMFHSIYGTELFQGFKLELDRRAEVRQLIGERAERLGYVNCVMDRSSFDAEVARGLPPYRIVNRITRETIELSEEDFDDLCRVHLCDWLEQVPRSKRWDYRRDSYRHLALRLGGIAKRDHDRVYGQERSVGINPQLPAVQ
jgi:hypothetical protein